MGKDKISLEMQFLTDEASRDLKTFEGQLKSTIKVLEELIDKGEAARGTDVDKGLRTVLRSMSLGDQAKAGMKMDARNPNARPAGKDGYGNDASGKPMRPDTLKMEEQIKKFEKGMSEIFTNLAKAVNSVQAKSAEQARIATPRANIPGVLLDGDELFPSEAALGIRQTQRDRQRVTSRVTSSIAGMDRATSAGRITHKEDEVLRGHMSGAIFGATGATPEKYGDVVEYARKGNIDAPISWDVDPESPLGRARSRIEDSSYNIQKLMDAEKINKENIKKEQETVDRANERRKEDEAGYKLPRDEWGPEADTGNLEVLQLREKEIADEMKNQNKLREENRKLLIEIIDGVRRVSEAAEKFEEKNKEGGVTVDPVKGSMADAIASRKNALALVAMSTMVASVTKDLRAGKQVVEGERPQSLEIGFSSGNYDFRQIRRDARDSGEYLGYKGTEMMQFGQQVMGSMGYSGENDGITHELARSERYMGTSEGTMGDLITSALRSGSLETSGDTRDFVDMIAGGIQTSGMVGRQEEQVTAMKALYDETAAGRAVSEEEAKRQMTLMGLLSGTGNKALQGQNLQMNMGSVNDAIASSSMFSRTGYLMGVGQEGRFQGSGGAHEYGRVKEQGMASQEFLDSLTMLHEVKGDAEFLDDLVSWEATAGLSYDAREGLLELVKQGDLTPENIEKQLGIDVKTGEKKLGEADEAWRDSPDQMRLQNENLQEQILTAIDDSVIGDVVQSVKGIALKMGASSPAASIAYTGAKAGMAGVGSVIGGSIGMGVFSKLLGKFGGTKMGNIIETLKRGSEAAAATGGGGKGFLGSMGSGVADWAGGLTSLGAKSMLDKSLGLKSGMAIAGGAYNVATADRKGAEAVSQTGKVGGNILGSAVGSSLGVWGAAKAAGFMGAKLGTVMGGPLGTLIGGGLGMIGGGALGKLGGGAIGDWAAGKFFGGTDEQHKEGRYGAEAEDSGSGWIMSAEAAQQDLALTSAKSDIETRRKDNVHGESRNLSEWDKVLIEIRDVLSVARKQNGIIGLMNGMGTGGAGGGDLGVGGELGYVQKGSYWTDSDRTKHDLGMTTSTLTAGQLDAWIADKAKPGSSMLGMGSAFMEAGNQSGLDPRYLVAHAAWETGWGQAKINTDKKNFYGIGAFDSDPYNKAYQFDSNEDGIIGGAKWIAENYYQGRGADTLRKMNVNYATDPNWAAGIGATMAGSEAYTTRSEGNVTINTTVNMKSTGSNKKDAETIGTGISKEIIAGVPGLGSIGGLSRFSNEYRPY